MLSDPRRVTDVIQAVIFDWGGTLTPFIAPEELEDVWLLAARHLAPDRPEELVRRLVEVEAGFWRRTLSDQRSFTLVDVLEAASREVGLDVAEALFEEAGVRHLDAWTPHVRHDPHAVDVLRALRERDLAIGLLSNTHWPRAFHERFLERDGLADLIDARLYTSEMPSMKPHPTAFRAALDALGIENASRAVFVGDRPWDDIVGATRAGLRAVHRPNAHVPDHSDARPAAVIHELRELVGVIDAWARG